MNEDCKKKAKQLAERLGEKRKSDIEKLTNSMESKNAKEIENITKSKDKDCEAQMKQQNAELLKKC